MPPHVAERTSVERAAGHPDRCEPVEQRAQDRGCADRALRAVRRQEVVQRPRPRRRAEHVALGRERVREPPQERRAAVESHERVGRVRLEQRGKPRFVERRERRGVDAQRIARCRGEGAGHEGAKARHAQPLGARVARPARHLDVAPCRPRAGVEQHADDRQVDLRARALGRRAAGERTLEFRAAVHAAGLEVPPAAVVRDGEVRIAAARHVRDAFGRVAQARTVDAEVARLRPPSRPRRCCRSARGSPRW